jgi:hypothetical protein
MKENLLKLINACIENDSMYTHTYDKNSYRGIKNVWFPRISHVSSVEYCGEYTTNYLDKYEFNIKSYLTQMEAYCIVIGFGKEPQITINPILKGNATTPEHTKHTKHKVTGKRKNFFGIWKPAEFDVHVVHEPHHYELRCGSFAYILEDSVVKDFYDRIIERRKEVCLTEEEKEINRRLEEFGVTKKTNP